MIQSWIILAFSLGYVGLLFAVAYRGDRIAALRGRPSAKPIVYALSLAVYCTSWTFYGSVGLAAKTGYDFLPIYIGPILMFGLGWPLLHRIVRLSKAHNITSIADFIAARYGKSQLLAAAITVIAVIGTLPYIALQLKAVSSSFSILVHYPEIASASGSIDQPLWSDTALIASLILALFAILFGTRHIDATEHNEGMILAIAFESLVKLVAFLGVGAFVTWGMFDGFADLAARVRAEPQLSGLFSNGTDGGTWLTMTALALTASVCLPRQFHVMVVENANESDLSRATWLFPLYLVAINIFVVPIAIAGLIVFPNGGVDADLLVLALPIAAGQDAVALLAFIGGLSAATGMVIVASVAVSNMVSNDLIMPVVLHGRRLGLAERENMSALILRIRRAAIVALMLLSYFYYRLISDSLALASIGLLSFAATAQFAPAFFGGLFWRSGTRSGALAGIVAGFLVWAYTLLLPSLADSGWLPSDLLENGPFGIGLLRPQQLFGLRFSPLTHGVFWSVLVNVLCFIVVSLLGAPRVIERIQASAFADPDATMAYSAGRTWHGSIPLSELKALATRYLGAERAQRSFADFAAQNAGALSTDAPADLQTVRHTERLLASAIGAPSARLVMALTLERHNLGFDGAMRLLDDATAAIQYNRDLLQTTLENVGQGITVFDGNLRLACWNRRFQDLLDLPPELVRVGVTLQEIIRFNAERGEFGAGDVDQLVAQRLELFIGSDEAAFERERPNGTVLEIRSSRMPGGGYVSTYSDITEHVRAATELAAANELLEQRVRDRTAALMAANEALISAKTAAEEANLGKTRFLAAVSHDLLQPLNAARLYVSSLLEQRSLQRPTNDELPRKIDASLGSVEELLGTLLDISRLDTGALTPERQDFPLQMLFDALRVEFAALAERKGIDLRITPTTIYVQSDRRLLYRVLQNLLSNAIRYTASGKVLMGARRIANQVDVQVIDTGIGIPPDKHHLVYQEFQRFAPTMDHGLGLGLSIVDRITRVLNHDIGFRSEPGHGSCFRVRVPRGCKTNAPEQAEAVAAAGTPPLTRATVLCIDNDRAVLDGMKALLESWSCDVRLARNFEEAIEGKNAVVSAPDLLLVDYHLDPAADGIRCVEALRRHYGATVLAILITADRSEHLKAAASAMGLPLLNKPLKPAALRALITRMLAARGPMQ